jgi:hypothetical protein
MNSRPVPQAAHEQPSSAIVLDQVVLNVERLSRSVNQFDSGIERVVAACHESETAE